MRINNNYSNQNKNYIMNNKNNLKTYNNYYSIKNEPVINNSLEKKNKKQKIKPPFKQGLYSYKQSFSTLQNDYNKNILNHNFFSNDSPNNAKYSHNNNYNNNSILNLNNIIQSGGNGHNMTNNNSLLSFTSINLNKYKINMIPNQKSQNINLSNNNTYNNNNNNNYNNVKNTNMSLNINLNNINSNNNNYNNNNLSKKVYHNYFGDTQKYEKESRRMIIEYIKILNKNNNNIKQTLLDSNISQKVLNQKFNDSENDNLSSELFGEAKKQLYLKNLNYSLSYDSYRTNEENSINVGNNNLLNLNNLNDILLNKEKKKINILNFLFVPRVLNLIEENKTKERYIFLITLDETYFNERKENYLFQWRNMTNNEIENMFKLKEIKTCVASNNYKNRFIIEVEKEDLIENLNFEIEAPTNEICNNYIIGLNYLLELNKQK